MKYLGLVNISGQMVKCTKGNGKKIRCMVKELCYGEMESNMKDISLMINVREKVHSNGRMEESMRVNGKMENNMEKANIEILRVILN